jgi:hypothetical protein
MASNREAGKGIVVGLPRAHSHKQISYAMRSSASTTIPTSWSESEELGMLGPEGQTNLLASGRPVMIQIL